MAGSSNAHEEWLRAFAVIAAADGRIDPSERGILDRASRLWALPAEAVDAALEAALAGERRVAIPGSSTERRKLLEALVDVACVDGEVDSRERRILTTIASRIGVDSGELEALIIHSLRRAAEPDRDRADDPKTSGRSWETGTRILGVYDVMGPLGRGGMGEVHRVHHRGWDLDLAVKCPRPELLRVAGGRECFAREAETWVNLGFHPHVVTCHYVRTVGGAPLVFSECMEGGSLLDWIRDGRLYDGEEHRVLGRILDIAAQVAWGLHHAHEHGVIHQDVKPANVLMSTDGTAKVADFGLARARGLLTELGAPDEPGQSLIVSHGGLTPAYCSPEQAAREKLSRRTDTWSWAVSVLEMFTGEITWRSGALAAAGLVDVLERRAGEAHATEGTCGGRPVLPSEVAQILRDCLELEPPRRPRSLERIAHRVRAVSERLGAPIDREPPEAAVVAVDALNNRAISLIDLGRGDEGERLLDKALAIDGKHLHALYNRGLLQVRSGTLEAERLVRQLDELRRYTDTWELEFLIGCVHLEQGHAAAATQSLESARRILGSPGNDGALAALGAVDQALAATAHAHRRWHSAVSMSLTGLQLSFDDRVLVGAGLDGTVQSWDAETGIAFDDGFRVLGQPIEHLAISADGETAVVAAGEGLAPSRLVSRKKRRGRLGPSGHRGRGADDVAEGRARVAGRETLCVVELPSKECRALSRDANDPVTAIALSADGVLAVTGTKGGWLELWDTRGTSIARFHAAKSGAIRALALLPDGRWLIVGSAGWPALQVWSIETLAPSFQLENSTATTIAVTPDGSVVCYGTRGGVVRVLGLTAPAARYDELDEAAASPVAWCAELHTLQGNIARDDGHDRGVAELPHHLRLVRRAHKAGGIEAVALTADGRFAALVGGDGSAQVWELKSEETLSTSTFLTQAKRAQRLSTISTDSESSAVALRSDGRVVFVSDGPGTLSAFNVRSRTTTAPFAIARPRRADELLEGRRIFESAMARSRAALTDGRRGDAVATLAEARAVPGYARGENAMNLVRDIASRVARGKFAGAWFRRRLDAPIDDTIGDLSFDGTLALACSIDTAGRVAIWEPDGSGEGVLWTLPEDVSGDTVLEHAILARWARVLVWIDRRGRIRVVEPRTGVELASVKTGIGVTHAALSPDGGIAAMAGHDRCVRVWDLRTGALLSEMPGHSQGITAVGLSDDGRRVVSAGKDTTVRAWDVPSGRPLWLLDEESHSITALSVSADGRTALSASYDGTVRLLDVVRGRSRSVLAEHGAGGTVIASTPDASVGASAGADRVLRIFDLMAGECILELELEDEVGSPRQLFLSSNARHVGLLLTDGAILEYQLDWDLVPRDGEEWDEGVMPHLELFLSCSTRDDPSATSEGSPWTDDRLDDFLRELADMGWGWIESETVRSHLTDVWSKRGRAE